MMDVGDTTPGQGILGCGIRQAEPAGKQPSSPFPPWLPSTIGCDQDLSQVSPFLSNLGLASVFITVGESNCGSLYSIYIYILLLCLPQQGFHLIPSYYEDLFLLDALGQGSLQAGSREVPMEISNLRKYSDFPSYITRHLRNACLAFHSPGG